MEENIKSKMKENIKSKMEENIKFKMEENIKSFPSSEDMKTPTINNKIGISENPVYNEDTRMETTIGPNLMNGSQSLNSTPGPGFQSPHSTPGPIRFKNLLLDQSRNHQVYFNVNINLNFKSELFFKFGAKQNILLIAHSAKCSAKIFFISK